MNSKYTGKQIEDLLDKISISGPGGSGGISVEEINKILDKCLRKDQSDRSPYSIASDEKIEVGEFRSGSSGAIIYIDKATGKAIAELDKLYIRMKAYFEQLEIIKSNIVGGKQIISPAGGIKCSKVETYPSWGYYRCFFLAAQEGEQIDNLFTIGDQAYSKTFNAKEGVYNQISNKYYWRLVVGVGEDYIDLSKSDCDADSDEPSVGDIICHRGNRNDIDRQNFIEFSSVDSFSPSITLYQQVNNYSLVDKAVIQFGVEKSTSKAFMNIYGDYYIGNRDKSSYISYTPETGVKIKGSLDVGTKLGDKTLQESIEQASNSYKEPLDTLKQSINEELKNVQKQIDGVIETWFYEPIPTLTNLPASLWTTNNEKEAHLGDLYYSGSGRAYRFQYDSDTSNYYWNEIVDTDILLALENAKKAQDTADSKRKTFVRKPENIDSYDIGDIWVNATYSDNTVTYDQDLLRAIESKAVGEEFKIEHWTLASKYTDDTVANDALEKATNAQQTINTLQGDVTNFKNYVDGAFLDGIISTSESQAIEKYINQLVTIKAQVDNSYEEIIKNSVLTSTTYLTNLNNSYTAFSSSYNELINTITEAIEDNIVTDLEKSAVDSKYNTFNNKYKDYVSYLNQAINYIEETINNKADKALQDIGGYNYLKKALQENTSITGGLIQSSMLSLGYTNSNGEFLVMAGTNGLVVDRGNKTIASWFGGGMIDMFDYYDSTTKTFNIPNNVRVATGVDRMDGTGYRANGKFWWDESGKLYADPLSFFVGDTAVGGLLAAFQIVMKSDGVHPQYLIPQVPFQSLEIADYIRIGDALLKYDSTNKAIYVTSVDGNSTIGFYSEGWVSAKGANPSSGGGSGASALYQLLDVLPNAGNDGVFNAVNGSVLTYNGTKWQAGIIHIPTNLSEFNNDSGFITIASVPTKLSAFTNDSGYITSAAIPTSLKNPYALKFGSQSYDGSSAKTITASDLGALTSHQSIYALTIKANDATVLTFTPNIAAGSIAFVAGSNISLSSDATNKKITIANTYSYTHPTNGANTTIAAAAGKVLGAITVNSLGHVTSVSAKTLVAADVTDLADVLDDYATITYVNDELAYTNETVSALVEKVNNFLEGTDTDGIINKWKELEAFLAGQTQTSTLADLLNVKAFASTKIIAGTGLTGGGDLTADRTLSLAASGVTAGTYPKVTVDKYGRITAGSSLVVDDIPNLPWSKITSGKPTTLTGYGITDGVNSVKVDGSGNAVTAASVSGHVLTLTKGVTFLPQSSFDELFEKVLLEDGKTYAIRAKYGFYSDSFVSAKGLNPSSSGGGSGASALYQLLDVVPNSTNTGVQGAVSGAVLMYNGSKWKAGIISVPNALSQLTNDAGFITSAALPTKVSQLNNDAGYITGVNSSMVISALGYTPYNSSNPNGYITGISKSMVEGVLTGNITSHTHNQYLTEHQSIYSLTFNAGEFTKDIYTPNSEAKTINIPTTTSHISEGNNLYFTNQRAINALSVTLLGYQPLISDLEIIRNSASEGHTAYGWGNHANAGYLTTIDSTMVVNALGYTPYNSSNPNGYISGITKAMVENVLTGNITSHTHTFASITSKPTTIAGYGITDAITTNNIGSQSVNYATSAGNADTLDGVHNGNLTAKYFSVGELLTSSDTINKLMSGVYCYMNANNPVGSVGDNAILLSFRSGYRTDMFQIASASNEQSLYYRLASNIGNSYEFWSNWREFAFTDSNVLSATKLQTPRTIWGQSFDGTGNIDGRFKQSLSTTTGNVESFIIETIDIDTNWGVTNFKVKTTSSSAELDSYYTTLLSLNAMNRNVGIGTTSTSAKLHVKGDTYSVNPGSNVVANFDGQWSNWGYDYTRLSISFNSELKGIIGWNSVPITASQEAGLYLCNYVSGAILSFGNDSNFYFLGNGSVGIGTTSPSEKLYVAGNIAATGAITAKASSSDIRLKTDISSYSAIDIIRSHKSIKYHWNDVAKANADIFNDDDWHYGLIAQEMQKDMPQMVSDVFKDYLVINYERLIPICWKGLQEVDDEVSRLKKKVRKLEMEIRQLKQGA